MINIIWFLLLAVGIIVGAATGKMQKVTDAAIESAGTAVTLSIGLIGVMALWLGIMKIAEEGGLVKLLARAVRPIMVRLFPGVPKDHPAMGAMMMNISANILGLGNAATPLGIKAMTELEKLNPHKGVATNAMVMFLAINTSSVTLISSTTIALRASAGSHDPTSIIGPTILATICSTIAGITAALLLQKLPIFSIERALKKASKSENIDVPRE